MATIEQALAMAMQQHRRGQLQAAEQTYRQILRADPRNVDALNLLGVIACQQRQYRIGIDLIRQAIKIEPRAAEPQANLANALSELGMMDEAVAAFHRVLELNPDFAEARSNMLCTLQYCPGVTPAALLEAHAEYDRRHAAALRGVSAQPRHIAGRHERLRIGFVSPDLGRHPVGYFLVQVLENLRAHDVETICYCDRAAKDDLTRRLQIAATGWCDVLSWTDQRVAEQIRVDQVDILFDLAGHTTRNRMLVFARKPAPIQVTWAGYVGTTGLSAMDYLLADRYQVPAGAEQFYRERVLRMPDGYVCYDPPDYAPPVAPLPALPRGEVTLGCFNNPAKITAQVMAVWAGILRRLPSARLVLKLKAFNDTDVAQRLTDMWAAQAMEPARLRILGRSPHAELLAQYAQIDLALDPFPYSGGLTTCEALWMGVPVVTCPGETFASRHSLSHLSNVGLTQMIARDLDGYVELAVTLASDLPALAMVRKGLREWMANSPLCDGKRFAATLVSLLHNVWEQRGNGG
jgi:predicted O-linked N-acetylglucosamine transferase (SPINDLY family)